MAAKKEPKPTVPCPDCGGRKTVAFGTADVRCARCKGRGTVKA